MAQNNESSFRRVQRELMIAPLQLLAALLIVAGTFALMFEISYYKDFSIEIYFGRVIATIVGLGVLLSTNFDFGKKYPILITHLLLITIILSFTSIILDGSKPFKLDELEMSSITSSLVLLLSS